jgi:hypothetical protein
VAAAVAVVAVAAAASVVAAAVAAEVAVAHVPDLNVAPSAAEAKGGVRTTAFRTALKACCRST